MRIRDLGGKSERQATHSLFGGEKREVLVNGNTRLRAIEGKYE